MAVDSSDEGEQQDAKPASAAATDANGKQLHTLREAFSQRRLPFIIGTVEFMQDELCGLSKEQEEENIYEEQEQLEQQMQQE